MRTQTLLALCAALTVAACCSVASGDRSQIPRGDRKDRQMQAMHDNQSIVGPEGLMLFGGSGEEQPDTGGGIGVNSFLWRASLDTFSFLPATSADPFGGVILTDWYSVPQKPNERFKLKVYTRERMVRTDGLQVAMCRQTSKPAAGLVDARGTERCRE